LDKIIGLTLEKEKARIDIVASYRLKTPFPHSLFYGVGGCGKTLFAKCIAEELQYYFIEKEGSSLRSRKDIVELLIEADHQARSHGRILLLFVDEIHRLTCLQQEVFYYPMIEWRIDQGNENWYPMHPFTLMGATTQLDQLDKHSFQNRFQNVWEIKSYNNSYMTRIISNILNKYRISYTWSDLLRVVAVCGGIPRTANRLCLKLHNYCVSRGRSNLCSKDIDHVFYLEHITQ